MFEITPNTPVIDISTWRAQTADSIFACPGNHRKLMKTSSAQPFQPDRFGQRTGTSHSLLMSSPTQCQYQRCSAILQQYTK